MNAAPALQVHAKLRKVELRRVILLALGGLVMSGGMAAFGVWQAWEVYLEPNPLKVVYAAGGAFMAGLVGVGTWREQRVSLNRLTLAESLAKDGELTIVKVLSWRRDDNGFRAMLRYTLRTPNGATHEASIAVSEGGAYRVDELGNESAALLSRDGRRVLLLTRSGYPLLNAAEALAHASATNMESAR